MNSFLEHRILAIANSKNGCSVTSILTMEMRVAKRDRHSKDSDMHRRDCCQAIRDARLLLFVTLWIRKYTWVRTGMDECNKQKILIPSI